MAIVRGDALDSVYLDWEGPRRRREGAKVETGDLDGAEGLREFLLFSGTSVATGWKDVEKIHDKLTSVSADEFQRYRSPIQ